MRAGLRLIRVVLVAVGALTVAVQHAGLVGVAEAQADDSSDFRIPLSKAIKAAESSNLVNLRQKLKKTIGNDHSVYSCYLLLPGSETCEIYLYEGLQSLKNFVVWDYGRGKTREAAEQVFAEVVKKITQGMPGDWVGQETPKSDLGARKLREFKASAKSNGGQTIRGPSISVDATRLGELYWVLVQLNSHHVD